MKIRISASDVSLDVTLDDTPTARDFVRLLPLRLTLEDYASTEKIAMLPRKLSVEGAPAGSDPEEGDFSYYAPWGNLALFYRDFGYSSGLVRLGRMQGDLGMLRRARSLAVSMERLGE
jgi:hypothetical protein